MAEPSEELMAKLLLLLQQQDKMLQQQDKTKLLLEQSSEAFRRTATGAMSAILSGQRSCRPEKTAPQYGEACPLRNPSSSDIFPPTPQALDALLPARSPDSALLRGVSAGAGFLALAAVAALAALAASAALLALSGAKK